MGMCEVLLDKFVYNISEVCLISLSEVCLILGCSRAGSVRFGSVSWKILTIHHGAGNLCSMYFYFFVM